MKMLKVWHIPQIPGKPFEVEVHSDAEGRKLLRVLADYDLFQFAEKIKPDYSNAQGLSVFDPTDKTDSPQGSWVDGLGDDEMKTWRVPYSLTTHGTAWIEAETSEDAKRIVESGVFDEHPMPERVDWGVTGEITEQK